MDEAGNGQTLDPAGPDAPPVLVVGGFTVHDSHIKQLTWDFLNIKKTYRPQLRRALHLSEVITRRSRVPTSARTSVSGTGTSVGRRCSSSTRWSTVHSPTGEASPALAWSP
ncbi:hypothetical protein [Streptomyces sp. JHA26]|uniref:hypothetical protein n=1 Tax=Streptomyces sp. JHA26 TaxID=1917143 RepID=UPI0035CF944F